MTLDAERLKIIKELKDFFEEYDRELPEWLREQRAQARRIFFEYEERGFPAGRHGMDFDLLAYRPDIARKHKPRKSLVELDDEMKKIAESAGQRIDERGRAGTKLQEDADTTYLAFTEEGQKLLEKFPNGVVVEDIEHAVHKYPWIEKLFGRILPMNLDKYTAYNAGHSIGGVFVWVKGHTARPAAPSLLLRRNAGLCAAATHSRRRRALLKVTLDLRVRDSTRLRHRLARVHHRDLRREGRRGNLQHDSQLQRTLPRKTENRSHR